MFAAKEECWIKITPNLALSFKIDSLWKGIFSTRVFWKSGEQGYSSKSVVEKEQGKGKWFCCTLGSCYVFLPLLGVFIICYEPSFNSRGKVFQTNISLLSLFVFSGELSPHMTKLWCSEVDSPKAQLYWEKWNILGGSFILSVSFVIWALMVSFGHVFKLISATKTARSFI